MLRLKRRKRTKITLTTSQGPIVKKRVLLMLLFVSANGRKTQSSRSMAVGMHNDSKLKQLRETRLVTSYQRFNLINKL